MGEADKSTVGAQITHAVKRPAANLKRRLAAGGMNDANIAPAHASAQAKSHRLEKSFFCCKPGGVAHGTTDAPRALSLLCFGEYTLDKTIGVAGQCALYSRNLYQVNSNAHNHRSIPPMVMQTPTQW
jgi:hypothetical protein